MTKIPGGVLPYICHTYLSEIRSRVRIWRAGHHIPTTNSQEYLPGLVS